VQTLKKREKRLNAVVLAMGILAVVVVAVSDIVWQTKGENSYTACLDYSDPMCVKMRALT